MYNIKNTNNHHYNNDNNSNINNQAAYAALLSVGTEISNNNYYYSNIIFNNIDTTILITRNYLKQYATALKYNFGAILLNYEFRSCCYADFSSSTFIQQL